MVSETLCPVPSMGNASLPGYTKPYALLLSRPRPFPGASGSGCRGSRSAFLRPPPILKKTLRAFPSGRELREELLRHALEGLPSEISLGVSGE